MEFIRFIFKDFFTFFGFLILFATTTQLIFRIWNRFWRHLNIRSQGWPPSHLDADGDFKGGNDDD